MIGGPGPGMMIQAMDGSDSASDAVPQRIRPGIIKQIVPYTKPYLGSMTALILATTVSSLIIVGTPLLFKMLIDEGIVKGRQGVILGVALAVAGLALVDLFATLVEAWFSGRVSEGMIYDLRTKVFAHINEQPLAFFTRTQTGALISRLNTDVVAAQQALTMLLSSVMSGGLALILVLGTMFYLSWQITIVSMVVLPLFVVPGRLIGRRMQRLMRDAMQLNAEMGSVMEERFNVAGALLAKLYGRPGEEVALFAAKAAKVRDISVVATVYTRMLMVTVAFLAAIATAVVYGVGGWLAVRGSFEIGTLVALATLLTRLFGPINQLSNVQANVMTALVSFDRLFELLDLKPLITEKAGAVPLTVTDRPARPEAAKQAGLNAPEIEFEDVSFRYPSAADISLASLETMARPIREQRNDVLTLRDLSFRAPAGKLTALVGPSGAGKTTITHLVPRLYDPISGTVRIGGQDIRDVTMQSLRDTVGMVTQDAHMYHETIRANLLYARPDATTPELVEACQAAQIWDLIQLLPDGFDTVLGDRGYRFSGGEKQRLAIARLLLKSPSVVVLDEATAHLDSESEAAVQRALRTALAGRTSLVIAHRLSTIRDADQILVVQDGRITESGVHEELLEAGGTYADLYRTQFARRPGREADVELVGVGAGVGAEDFSMGAFLSGPPPGGAPPPGLPGGVRGGPGGPPGSTPPPGLAPGGPPPHGMPPAGMPGGTMGGPPPGDTPKGRAAQWLRGQDGDDR